MQNPIKKPYPRSREKVLGYSQSEKTWIPLTWDNGNTFWMCYFKNGNAQVFEPEDIIEWMDMPPAPTTSLTIDQL